MYGPQEPGHPGQSGHEPGVQTPTGQATPPPHAAAPAGTGRKFPLSTPLMVGMVAAVAGFLVELSFYSKQTVNGTVQECTSVNIAPLVLGPVAVVAGIIAMVRCRRAGKTPMLELGLGLAAVVAGVAAIALRAFGGEC